MSAVQALILDFQGGALLSTPEQVAAAQRVPTKDRQREMAEAARDVLEGLEAASGNQQFEAVVHGTLVTSLWELLEMEDTDVSELHRALSGATIDAASQLLKVGRTEDAFAVLLAGQVLYANVAGWLQAKST